MTTGVDKKFVEQLRKTKITDVIKLRTQLITMLNERGIYTVYDYVKERRLLYRTMPHLYLTEIDKKLSVIYGIGIQCINIDNIEYEG